ncbi:MAG TPA: diguanylate cyclase [Geobacteraceae bacterium]
MPKPHFIHCDLQSEPCRSRYAKIIEKSINGIIVMDGNGTVRFANHAAVELLGRPVDELLGKPGDFLCDGADGGELFIGGEDRAAVAAEIRMVETEWGDETARLAFMRDVTERRRTEEALKATISRLEEEKARFEAIIAAIGDGITIQDTDFRIVYQNQTHRKIMGDHLGAYCYRAYAHRDEVCDECRMRGSFRDGGIHTVERCYTIDRRTVHLETTVSPLTDAHGKVIARIEVVRDITARKQTEDQLRFMSTHDILTGLYNRFYFEQELIKLERGRRFPLSIVMADVDDLKVVNDRLGHVAGDGLLKEAATLLREAFRGEDVVARVGGDEFAVLLPDTGEAAVQAVVARIKERQRFWNETHAAPISLSMGIAVARDGSQLPEALKAADRRMYEDKLSRTGRPPRQVP